MHDQVTGSSKPRRGRTVVRLFEIVVALITASVALVVIVLAVVTIVLWLTLGATLWLVGAAAGIARDGGGRRLRSMGVHLMRSGPSRWLLKAAVHRSRQAWSRRGSAREVRPV
jgi:hypothetical protein